MPDTRRHTGHTSERVFEQIEQEIVDRVRPPGSRLVEGALASELGVSRTPVREALRMLQRAGWIDVRPHAGASVRQPGMDDARDVFALRELLEPETARLAAERAAAADLRRLARLVERGERAAQRADAKALVALNSEFHRTLGAATSNRLLRRFVEELDQHVRWLFAAVATSRGPSSWTEHAAIVAAVEQHDGALAARLSLDHVRRTREAYLHEVFGLGSADDGASTRSSTTA